MSKERRDELRGTSFPIPVDMTLRGNDLPPSMPPVPPDVSHVDGLPTIPPCSLEPTPVGQESPAPPQEPLDVSKIAAIVAASLMTLANVIYIAAAASR